MTKILKNYEALLLVDDEDECLAAGAGSQKISKSRLNPSNPFDKCSRASSVSFVITSSKASRPFAEPAEKEDTRESERDEIMS